MAGDHGDRQVLVVTRGQHICARLKAGCVVGPRQRWERAEAGEDSGAHGKEERGSGVRLGNTKCPMWDIWGVRGSQACAMLGASRKPFLPEVGTCGLWGHWVREREKQGNACGSPN